MSDTRKDFEGWFGASEWCFPGTFDRRISEPDFYANPNTQIAYDAWQAAMSQPVTGEMVGRGVIAYRETLGIPGDTRSIDKYVRSILTAALGKETGNV